MAYQPPLCPVSHPLGLTSDSSCICDFTHFVLTVACFKCTTHTTHFLPWGFPVSWVRDYWKTAWNAHRHSPEVGLEGWWGVFFTSWIHDSHYVPQVDNSERDLFHSSAGSSGIQPQWPTAVLNTAVHPWTGFFSSPSCLFPHK